MEGQQVYSQNQHWGRREGKEVVLRNPCNVLQLPEPAIYIKLENKFTATLCSEYLHISLQCQESRCFCIICVSRGSIT